MKLTRAVLGLGLALALPACGGLDVTTDWDPSFDFATPRTFTVLTEAGGEQLSGLNDARVRSAIAMVMEEKGFREVSDTTEADLAVGYQFTSEQRSSYQTVNTGWSNYGYGGYGRWYRGGVGMSTSTTTERRYDVGSLLIAVFDTGARQMVFTSTGSRTLKNDGASPEEMQRRVEDAVYEILRDFPPGG